MPVAIAPSMSVTNLTRHPAQHMSELSRPFDKSETTLLDPR